MPPRADAGHPSTLGSPMAEILSFTTRPLTGRVPYDPACPGTTPSHPAYASTGDLDEDGGAEEDAPGGIRLGLVARLAAAPSRTLADLTHKAEVLVARLAPDDGAESGLCAAEVALLQSVLRDLRAVADDIGFVLRGAGRLTPAAAE